MESQSGQRCASFIGGNVVASAPVLPYSRCPDLLLLQWLSCTPQLTSLQVVISAIWMPAHFRH
jgi:hypothetical protein